MMMKKMMLPVFVNESVEGHAISPAGAEVVYVHVGIPEDKTEKKHLVYSDCQVFLGPERRFLMCFIIHVYLYTCHHNLYIL